jgi:hypothetical protein
MRILKQVAMGDMGDMGDMCHDMGASHMVGSWLPTTCHTWQEAPSLAENDIKMT